MGNLCLFENKQVFETFAKPEALSFGILWAEMLCDWNNA